MRFRKFHVISDLRQTLDMFTILLHLSLFRAKGGNTFLTLAEKRKHLQGKKTKRNEEEIAAKVKQFPCKRFKRGTCELSAGECRYSHDDTVANKNGDTETMVEASRERETIVDNAAQMMDVS